MKFTFPWAKKPEPVVHTIVQTPPQNIGLVKTGRWVIHAQTGCVGILTGVTDFPRLTVMLVNENGENFREETATLDQLRVAKCAEIPLPRRPSPEAGAALGYF